ncbi:MAG TPA: hypothetical protein VNQ73_21360 [Ilumatobacter sp.]|nr:hypothetical protein [Ilumatobacter sp.]
MTHRPLTNQRSFGEVRASVERRVAVVEDHLLQRNNTVALLAAQRDLRVVFAGETLPDLVVWLAGARPEERPHLTLLDLMVDRRPNADPAVVERLIANGVRVLVFSAMASPALVRQMMRVGVSGVVGKRDSEADILAAVRTVLGGGAWTTSELAAVIATDPRRPKLSVQEERALVLYASGLTMEATAAAIGVQRDTAKKYIERVKDKYLAAGRPLRSKLDLHRVVDEDGWNS